MIRFNKNYFFLSCALLLVLIYIALFVNDKFVRPFLGDVLVVGWIYLFVSSFIKVQSYKLAHWVLLFACTVEVAQYYKLVEVLGLQDIKAARIIIGSTFDWLDILAYIIGWLAIILIERYRVQFFKRKRRISG